MSDVTEAITTALKAHRPHNNGAGYWICECGHALPGQEFHEAHITEVVVGVLTANRWALVKPPSIAFKGPNDTDASMFWAAADKAESAKYPVGGSNVGRAVADILRQVAAAVEPTQKEQQ